MIAPYYLDFAEEDIWYKHMFDIALDYAYCNQWDKARDIAVGWANGVCDNLGLPIQPNWKFFKRELVAKWFGRPQNKKFSSGWDIDLALQYANQFTTRAVRFSLFPRDIACHASSYKLSQQNRDSWRSILLSVDNSIDMEMFPDAATSTSVCFRRYSSY